MTSPVAHHRSPESLLRLGVVSRISSRVGYRRRGDDVAHEQFLLDIPLPARDEDLDGSFDEQPYLAALSPVVNAKGDVSWHYSVDVHRSHSTWEPAAVEIGVTVTIGARSAGNALDVTAAVVEAFRGQLNLAGQPAGAVDSRATAVTRARDGVATAYGVEPDSLVLISEGHHSAQRAWTLGLRSHDFDEYTVLVGLVDGYPGSLHVRHDGRHEVSDSVGTE